jgi:hypothetical protein
MSVNWHSLQTAKDFAEAFNFDAELGDRRFQRYRNRKAYVGAFEGLFHDTFRV